jgi:hypothetical protein
VLERRAIQDVVERLDLALTVPPFLTSMKGSASS